MSPGQLVAAGSPAAQLTPGEAHHGQLLIAIGVDGHQVGGVGIQDVPPDDRHRENNHPFRVT